MTAQLLEAGYETTFEPKAVSWTVAPDTLRGFIAQRRRWDNSTLVNQIDLIFADKQVFYSYKTSSHNPSLFSVKRAGACLFEYVVGMVLNLVAILAIIY